MNTYQFFRIVFLSFSLLLSQTVFAQSVKQEKMEQLSFLIGEWIGTSASYKNGEVSREIPAFERISYDLDKHILVLELHSESLQLHTIIYYDEKDSSYYYFPFSKRGVRKIPAEFKDGKLIVWSSESQRYIFSSPGKNKFREHGERLVNGKWVKYFEDNFTNVK
ncbi:MAG: TIGR02922 family protein [Bacteroidia bacterium]|nr:TIGR02922 family protein [Bacteroidia bacterium]